MNNEETSKLLSSLQGRVVRQIRRIRYVVRGEITSDTGPIEITFLDRSVALLDAGPDGEALIVRPTAWIDYFTEPLSAENKRFVQQSGKWVAFDVTSQEPYSRLIEGRIEQVIPVRTLENKIKGVAIATAHCAVRVDVEADEVSVDIS